MHLPGSQFPVADAGIKDTHLYPAKAHILWNTFWAGTAPVFLQLPGAAESTWLWPDGDPSSRSGAEPRLWSCPGALCASRAMVETCWRPNLLVATRSCCWRKALTFSQDFVQDAAQFKGGDLRILWKRRKQIFHHLQTPPAASDSFGQVGQFQTPLLSPPPIPRSTRNSHQLAYPAARCAPGKSSLGRRLSSAICSAQGPNSG